MKGIKFFSIASYIPDKVVTNDDMSKIVDTNDEWIRTRTGIERRHFATDCTNVGMAVKAAEKALSQSGIDPEKLCCVVVASFTSEIHSPSIACLVQKELGLPDHVMAFDINAACSGFIYGLGIVRGLLTQNEGAMRCLSEAKSFLILLILKTVLPAYFSATGPERRFSVLMTELFILSTARAATRL